MAWEIAIVFDLAYETSALDGLTRQMPLWAVRTPERESVAEQIRADSWALWDPEPSFMLFDSPNNRDPEATLVGVLDVVSRYHPQVSALQIIGATSSDSLTVLLQDKGYLPAAATGYPGVRVRKPLSSVPGVRDLILDASTWKTEDDVYDSFFRAVGAPSWHGRNYQALQDSIEGGDINKIDAPYRLIIQNYKCIGPDAQNMAERFIAYMRKFESEGCPVAVQVDGT